MHSFAAVALLATLPAWPAAAAATESRCLQLGSEHVAFGDVTDAMWDAWTGIDLDFASNEEYLQVRTVDGASVLRQKLVPSSKGSERVTVKGDLTPAPTYTMSQRVYFEPGFDWGRDKQGGKLGFGLGGGTSPTGGDIDSAGFSARFMWRGNGDGTARIVVYSYAADRSQNLPFGDDYDLAGFTAPVDQWFTLTMEITANTDTTTNDGRIRAWADGHLALDRGGIAWQTSGGSPTVDRFLYSTFYGGNGWEWAPAETTFVQFADACWAASEHGEPDPPSEPPAGSPRAKLRGVANDVASLLPSHSGQVNWRLNYAREQLVAADGHENWIDAEALTTGNATMRHIERAISKLDSAASSDGATPNERTRAMRMTRRLASTSAALARHEVAAARIEIADRGCTCEQARHALSDARDELRAMRAADTPADIAYHARRAWSHARQSRA